MATFIDKCLRGEALISEIHNYIELWHQSDDDTGELHDFLGMTKEEYALFVEDEKNLGAIFYSRKHSVALDSVFQKDYRIAARSILADKEAEIEGWLNSMEID